MLVYQRVCNGTTLHTSPDTKISSWVHLQLLLLLGQLQVAGVNRNKWFLLAMISASLDIHSHNQKGNTSLGSQLVSTQGLQACGWAQMRSQAPNACGIAFNLSILSAIGKDLGVSQYHLAPSPTYASLEILRDHLFIDSKMVDLNPCRY